MKKFFSSEKGKRLLIGLGLIVLGIVMGIALQGSLLGSGVRWKQAIFFVCASGTGLAGLLYVFLARKGLLIGYGIILSLSLLLALPEPWKRYFVAVCTIVWIAAPTILLYLKKRKKKRDKIVKSPDISATRPMRVERLAQAQQTKDAPIFARHTANGNMYQVFFRDGEFLFYKIGSIWKETSEEKLIQPDNLPQMKKGDFAITAKEVTWLRFRDLEQDDNPFDQKISIHVQKRRYYLSTIQSAGGTVLEQLLRENAPQDAQDERKQKRRYIPSPERKRKRMLERVYLGICAVTLLVDVAWMFLDVPYRLFAWIALLPTPLLMLLYYLFPNEVSIAESKSVAHGRVMIMLGLMLSALVPALRTQLDFNILQEGRYLLLIGMMFVLLLVQAYISSPECRIRKVQLVLIGFVSLTYLVGAVGEVNFLLDRTPPKESRAVVQSMEIQNYSKSPTKYVLDVETEDLNSYSLDVSKPFYQETKIGEEVLVLVFEGALGIPYAEIEALPQNSFD